MNYSDVISRAFRTAKKGSLWGFVFSTYGATLLLFVIATVLSLLVAGSGLLGLIRSGANPRLVSRIVPSLFAVVGVFTMAFILSIPLSLIAYGGLIHQTDEAMAGRNASVRDAWRFGVRRMGRVFLVELVLGLVGLALTLVGVIPIVLAVIAATRSSSPGAGIVFGICGGSVLLFVLAFALWALGAFESLSIRYALIGDRSASDAIGAGWQALRARFGNVFVVLLMLFGFRMVVGIVQSGLNYALEFAGFGAAGLTGTRGASALQSGAAVLRVVPIFAVIYLIAFIVAIVWRVFDASIWTAFFRQMTGLDQAPATAYPASYSGPPSGGMPVAPQDASGHRPAYSPPSTPAPPIGPPMAPVPQPGPQPAPGPQPPGL